MIYLIKKEMMMNKKLEKLELIRKEQKLSRRELALLSGVAESTIQALEEGMNNIDDMKLSTLIKLSKALKVKPSALLNDDIAKRLK